MADTVDLDASVSRLNIHKVRPWSIIGTNVDNWDNSVSEGLGFGKFRPNRLGVGGIQPRSIG